MAFKDKIKELIDRLFRKKLEESNEKTEVITQDASGEATTHEEFVESLKDEIERDVLSYEERFNELLDNYQKIESNMSSSYPNTDEIPQIILGTILEKKGASREMRQKLLGSSKVRLAEANMWPSIYTKRLSSNDGPQVILPIFRELELIGYNNSEGLMNWKNTLMDTIDVSGNGNILTIKANDKEIYHGEECEVEYKNSYEIDGKKEIYTTSKYFDPISTAKNGIDYICKVTRIDGIDYEFEEEKRGYLDDTDNYYYKALRKPGTKAIHVMASDKKMTEDFPVEYDYECDTTIESFESSIAKEIMEANETTQTESGKQLLITLLGENVKSVENQELSNDNDGYDLEL